MKYKLINQKTGEVHLCEKVTVERFDYYLSGEAARNDVFAYNSKFKEVQKIHSVPQDVDFEIWGKIFKKVIATTNPNIDIPKVVDIVKALAFELLSLSDLKSIDGTYESYHQHTESFIKGVEAGYNKSQETHPFSEEDMVEFLKFYKSYILMLKAEKWEILEVAEEELLEVWKNQRTTILYYG